MANTSARGGQRETEDEEAKGFRGGRGRPDVPLVAITKHSSRENLLPRPVHSPFALLSRLPFLSGHARVIKNQVSSLTRNVASPASPGRKKRAVGSGEGRGSANVGI